MKKLIVLTIILFTVQFLTPIFGQTEQKPELIVQTGHSHMFRSISISPNGKILASSSLGSIKLWDIESGKELRTLGKGFSWIWKVVFSPDGKVLASVGDNKTVDFWNIETGEKIKTFAVNLGWNFAIVFSPDGKILACGNDDNTIKLLNIETGQILKTFSGHSKSIKTIDFNPNGKLLVSGSEDNSIKLWNVATGEEIKTLLGHSGSVDDVVFSPDGEMLASGSTDKTVKLWNVKSGKELKTFTGHTEFVSSVSFSPNGEILASGSGDTKIKFWNIKNYQELQTIETGVEVSSFAFSPDWQTLISFGGYFSIAKLWDVKSQKILKTFEGRSFPVSEVGFSPDGNILASSDWRVRFWGLKNGQQLKNILDSSVVNSFSYSGDGKLLGVTSIETGGKALKMWDIENEKELEEFKSESLILNKLIFSPRKNIFAIVSDFVIELRSSVNGNLLKTLTNDNFVNTITFSPDGKILACGDDNNKIKLWDVESGKVIKILSGHSSWIWTLSFSPDGKTLVSGSQDKTIKFWNVESGIEQNSLIRDSPAYSVVFSPSGETLAYATENNIELWNIKNEKELKSLSKNFSDANLNNFSAKSFINNLSPKNNQNINDIYSKASYTKNRSKFLRGHGNSPVHLAFSPNGKLLASAGIDGKITIWDAIRGKRLCYLVAIGKDNWVIVATDGRFDTNISLDNPQGLHWIMPDASFTPLSFEVFMRDYYEPNLLPRLLKCTEENNCGKEFKPVRNLTKLNRTQPKIKITEIKAANSSDIVQVKVEAEDTTSEFQKNKRGKLLHSGVQDLRLFRDGQLVGYAPDSDGAIVLDAKGRFTKTFAVRLPKNRDVKEFNFTAYAFNSDRVKSETAQKTYVLPQKLPPAKGNAYILTIGVNANEDRRYDLRYAANDARKLQEELSKRLPKDRYERIVQIPLVSDYDKDGKLVENNATKAKIRAVLDKLAGKTVAPDALRNVPNAELLDKVEPEDLVVISFSGHGYADREGIFYLLPYDIGARAGDVLKKSVSSDELSLWLRDVDAGEMLMIVDACHSAAAVQGKDFKPGPMGSRGLGQLSYDKGMRILTATQADNVALELGNLEHGLLTYSLVKNGLELGLADYQPKDGKLFSNEWLSFAVKDVPSLYEQATKGNLKNLLIDGKAKSELASSNVQKTNLNLQQPSLFDFSRRDRQYELVDLGLK